MTFPIPATARPGASYARFRLTGGEELQAPTRVVDFFGGAPNGEVEDLKVTLEAGQPEVVKDFGDAPETVGKLTTGFPTTLVRKRRLAHRAEWVLSRKFRRRRRRWPATAPVARRRLERGR